MDWWPDLTKIPPVLRAIFEVAFKRLDDVTPQEGQGTRVYDAAGGGKAIDATAGSNGGSVVKDTYFLVNGVRMKGDVMLRGGLREDVEP